MPSDEYTIVGGGALRLKGAKVDKKKKTKKKKGKSDLEKNLSTGEETAVIKKEDSPATEEDKASGRGDVANLGEEELEEEVRKTEAELRYEEYKKKRVRFLPSLLPSECFSLSGIAGKDFD